MGTRRYGGLKAVPGSFSKCARRAMRTWHSNIRSAAITAHITQKIRTTKRKSPPIEGGLNP